MSAPRPYAVLLAVGITVLFTLSAWSSLALTAGFDRIALIWFSNGIVVAALLVHHQHHLHRGIWVGLLGGAYVGNLLLNFALGDPPLVAFGIATANLLEIFIAAYALRGSLTASADLLQFRQVVRFFTIAMILAPCAGAVVAAISLHYAKGLAMVEVMRPWILADALGMGTVVPLALALRPRELLNMIRSEPAAHLCLALLMLLAVTLAVFSQERYPLLFLLLPPLLFVAFRLGFNGAALAISIVAAIAIAATLQGSGPFMLVPNASMAERVFPMQLLLGSLIITTYPICAILASQRRLVAEASDQAARMLATQSLISELNEHMRLAANAANIGFYTWKFDSNVLTCDEKLYKILHIDPNPEQPTYKKWRERVHPHDWSRVEHGLQQVAIAGTDLEVDFRIVCPDGSEREIRTRGVVQPAQGDRPRQLAGLSMDITELRQLDRMKSEFVSIVSHELRTPLTSIRGALGLLAGGKITAEKVPELLQLAQRNAERLAVLIDDILDMERIESGKLRFDLKPQVLNCLIEEAIEANTPYAARHQVCLRLANEAPRLYVHVDHSRLLQVMANLLSNAAKFSLPGSTVDIAVIEQRRTVRIAVQDHGPGIPTEFRGKIFGKFSQGDSSDTRQKSGSGLGLAITKALVEGMGGAISFITAAELGTTFFVDLPKLDSLVAPEFAPKFTV